MSADATSARQIKLHGSNRNARDHFNSQNTFYKTPFGAVRAGETVAFTLTVPVEFGCTTPYLLFNRDGEQPSLFPKQYFRNGMDVFSTTIQPQEPGLYFYYFDLTPATANYTPGSLARHMLQQATARPGS